MIEAFDVRIAHGRGRITCHIAAVSPAEARAQALYRAEVALEWPDAEVLWCRRSQYAVGGVERGARREFLEAVA